MSTLDAQNLAGATIAGCRLEGLIARGSMGSIWRGRHVTLDRPVAVKAFPVDAGNAAAVERLLAEARAIAKVDHPNVVQVHDVGVQEGLFYIVMQFLEGRTLKARFDDQGALAEEDLHSVAEDVGRGLEAIHARGIVHRDVKMENVIVGADGRARITDFGLVLEAGAKDEYKGRIVGTPAYISPEQWIGRPLDARADLYSLGVMLYALAAGAYPFPGPGATEFREQHLSARPKRPSELNTLVGESLSSVILKLLAKVRATRYQSAAEFLADLRRCREGKSPAALQHTGRAVRCPFCEEPNPSSALRCGVCGEMLKTASISLDLQLRPGEFECPGCRGVCPPDVRACPHCGKGICTKCRRAMAVRGDFCAACVPPSKR
jgi:serine/threonine protein kinase